MTLVAAAIVPAAPALLPRMGGAADPLRPLRQVSREAVADAVASAPGAGVVVVSGWGHSDSGGAARRPVRRDWPLDAPSGAERFTTGQVPPGALPTGLEIGRQLLADGTEARLVSVADDAAPHECLALGADLVADGPTVLVVVADGSAKRTVKAPGHLDERAEGFDAGLSRALAAADADALAALDPVLADELWCRGRAALQVLAGAAGGSPFAPSVDHDEAPYGVGYLVATWTPPPRSRPTTQ
ncbi:class III extradiol dioxygenase subunit B-like domain-containing protein [Marihabitans asiaticum]|uniref:Uncharacterized protein n=1 Tax=Marihabitans asiaticum TaxID=415218 RepID=A0A560WHI0_9MICO|nr:hypothetical protein [Marihabitans asiaticum]TWD17048.1 hypothetical protein FB557_0606 [Marihabitans asiaticum]